uniref:Membrane transporter protein n=1 Tax=Alexandrium monilatum TaxID=311494 RepID=A0A7S4R551_9DINO
MRRLPRRMAVALLVALPAAGDDSLQYGDLPVTDVIDVDGGGYTEQLPGTGIEVNRTATDVATPSYGRRSGPAASMRGEPEARPDMFAYHKELFPLDRMDVVTLILSALGLVIAGGGGIGGGGILVPLFMLVMKFRPKHAIALSNFTILGGSIANTVLNVRNTQEMGASLIDWDIVVILEPSTIAGAVLGSFLSKFLSDFVITILLVVVLTVLSYRTLDKGIKMFQRESEDEHKRLEGANTSLENADDRSDEDFNESEQLIGRDGATLGDNRTPWPKIKMLLVCLAGCIVLTILKGSGHGSILGVECGSTAFWTISLAPVPWVMMFGAYFRRKLMAQDSSGIQAGVVRWDATTTIKYPLVCSVAGIFAGLFGVGGGIVKGPLMLEMGVEPLVAAATAATMILFTTSAACVSFQVFGLLEPFYGAACFALGLVCTAAGQGVTNAWVKAARRQSPPVLSIGVVMTLSTVLVSLEAFEEFTQKEWDALLRPSDVCSRFD